MDAVDHARRRYPEVLGQAALARRVVERVLAAGGAVDQSLLAVSLCADEINASWLRCFPFTGPFCLGGLAGLPHAGLTGLTAFAHHVPEGGTAVIVYGPHLGLGPRGEWGLVARPGRPEPGACCGALRLALGRFLDNPAHRPSDDPREAQQAWLERLVAGQMTDLATAEEPLARLTERLYPLLHQSLHDLLAAVRPEFHCRRIVTCGGLILNTGQGLEDLFVLRDEQVVELE